MNKIISIQQLNHINYIFIQYNQTTIYNKSNIKEWQRMIPQRLLEHIAVC